MRPLLFRLVRSERRYTSLSCLQCAEPTSNPKFCSRSCAALFNNARTDIKRREPEGSCSSCGERISTRNKYCTDCRLTVRAGTKGTSRNRRNYICTSARKLYFQNRAHSCVICGYEKHVEVCHIKDVSSYPAGTSYLVINEQSNLVGLCPNHHWEFDHYLL